MQPNRTNPSKPDAEHCCDKCVFGRGQHAWWCDDLGAIIDRVARAHNELLEREHAAWIESHRL